MSTTEERQQASELKAPSGWPPHKNGGDDGEGGGGDGFGPEGEGQSGFGRTGSVLAMASIGTVFLAFVAIYLIQRVDGQIESGRPPEALWYSSLVILLSSIAAVLAVRAAAQPRHSRLLLWLSVTLSLGIFFCGIQVFAWVDPGLNALRHQGTRYYQAFFTMTALHVAHVLGGILYLGAGFLRALRGPGQLRRATLDNAVMYWHFVGIIWVLLFVVLLVF